MLQLQLRTNGTLEEYLPATTFGAPASSTAESIPDSRIPETRNNHRSAKIIDGVSPLKLSGKLKIAWLKMKIVDLVQHSKYNIFQKNLSNNVVMDNLFSRSTWLKFFRCQNFKSCYSIRRKEIFKDAFHRIPNFCIICKIFWRKFAAKWTIVNINN